MPNLPGSCEHEPAVRELARTNAEAPALRAHAERCAVCRDTLAVAAWMERFHPRWIRPQSGCERRCCGGGTCNERS